jgi:hypothetical protein
MPLVRYKPASRSISARPRRPTTAPDSPLINRVHHKSSPANRCVPRTLTIEARFIQETSEEKQEPLRALHALEAKLQQVRRENTEAEAVPRQNSV